MTSLEPAQKAAVDVSWQRQVLLAIPSINGGDLLARMLPTLRFRPEQVLVIDQGSTDGTERVCREAGVELLQLGAACSFTQALNRSAAIARERGVRYLCVANNDIVFRTDVLAELFAEMEADASLGIVAPSQLLMPEGRSLPKLACRTVWNLETVDFAHDLGGAHGLSHRLEADFCELTCALVRMAAIDAIGFLDDAYEFYYEDADFGFRLRAQGYSCAYLTGSQIEHYASSTFNRGRLQRKLDYILRNKRLFASKHLGYGVAFEAVRGISADPHHTMARTLHPYLRRYGLVDPARPPLAVGYPDDGAEGYLFTASQRPDLSAAAGASGLRAIFCADAELARRIGRDARIPAFHVPACVDPDVFHPWRAPLPRWSDATTFMALVSGDDQPFARALMLAWREMLGMGWPAHLVLLGPAASMLIGDAPTRRVRTGNLDIADFPSLHISACDVLAPLEEEERAGVYLSADVTIQRGNAESPPLAALQSMACGIPCILADGGNDMGSEASATWLLRELLDHFDLNAAERAERSRAAVRRMRATVTPRHSAMALHAALREMQTQDLSRLLTILRRREAFISRAVLNPVAEEDGGSRAGWDAVAARRVKTLGGLTTRFGTAWEQWGFAAARAAVAEELGYAASRRLTQLRKFRARTMRNAARRVEQAGAAVRPIRPKQGSVLLVGYIDADLGLGQSLRGLARALAGTPVPFAIRPVTVGVEGRRSEPFMPERNDMAGVHAVNVIEVTPDEFPNVLRDLGSRQVARSYNILRTYWELAAAPASWRERLAGIDEVWAPTRFVAGALAGVFDGPVAIVPPSVDIEAVAPDGAAELPEGRFHFLFSFDYFSFPSRKNPLGLLRAFRAAFPDPATPVGLLIKSVGPREHSPEIREALLAAAEADRRIVLIDRTLTREEMLGLLRAAGCYVSLHRSEGFGLGMAEAMALGKPVIGTAYSGNTDFLTEATGYPISYTLRPVRADEYVHTEGQVWAEPDEEEAAAAMRRVFGDRAEARARGEAGRRLIAERFSPASVGRVAQARLGEIFADASRARTARRSGRGSTAR